jgi:hypothetical protein
VVTCHAPVADRHNPRAQILRARCLGWRACTHAKQGLAGLSRVAHVPGGGRCRMGKRSRAVGARAAVLLLVWAALLLGAPLPPAAHTALLLVRTCACCTRGAAGAHRACTLSSARNAAQPADVCAFLTCSRAQLPLLAVLCFGVYSAVVIISSVVNFPSCPEAAAELQLVRAHSLTLAVPGRRRTHEQLRALAASCVRAALHQHAAVGVQRCSWWAVMRVARTTTVARADASPAPAQEVAQARADLTSRGVLRARPAAR